MAGETQVGGFIDNREVEKIDYAVRATGTSRVAVLRAMIRACTADVDAFIGEHMPPRTDHWDVRSDPYTRDARRQRQDA